MYDSPLLPHSSTLIAIIDGQQIWPKMSTFAALINFLKQNHAEDRITEIMQLGIRNLDSLLHAIEQGQFSLRPTNRGETTLATLAPASDGRCSALARTDVPHKRQRLHDRGNLQAALSAALPDQQVSAITHLRNDIHAASNCKPRASWWRTWSRLAEAWGTPPLCHCMFCIQSCLFF